MDINLSPEQARLFNDKLGELEGYTPQQLNDALALLLSGGGMLFIVEPQEMGQSLQVVGGPSVLSESRKITWLQPIPVDEEHLPAVKIMLQKFISAMARGEWGWVNTQSKTMHICQGVFAGLGESSEGQDTLIKSALVEKGLANITVIQISVEEQLAILLEEMQKTEEPPAKKETKTKVSTSTPQKALVTGEAAPAMVAPLKEVFSFNIVVRAIQQALTIIRRGAEKRRNEAKLQEKEEAKDKALKQETEKAEIRRGIRKEEGVEMKSKTDDVKRKEVPRSPALRSKRKDEGRTGG